MTGSQKVEGSNPSSSTNEATKANTTSKYLSISPNSYTQLAIPLDRLIEGFLLSCRVENKSPATVSFYKNILDKFQWFLDLPPKKESSYNVSKIGQTKGG